MCPSASDVIKIILSELEDKCIVVQDEASPSDVAIIQEGVGFRRLGRSGRGQD